VVRHIRNAYGIPGLAEHLRKAGWLTAGEIATQLRLHSSTAKGWAREGLLRAVRADDKGLLLFEPPTGPLPRRRRASDSATVAAIPSVRHTCGKRCSMKPEPSARVLWER
jgi:hypothetical protein